MNAQTQITAASSMNSVGLLNLEAFELSQRIAKMLASSTLVPEQYRAVVKVKAGKDQQGNMIYRDEENPNGLSNCIIALNMANRMGADPLMVMQNLYLIEGRPAWSSQFIMAAINSCGRFSALRFEIEDLGEKEVSYQETSWQNRQKQTVTKTVKVQNLSCVAWAIERETGERIESSKITMEMAVKEGWYGKNGSKWQTMPEQMLRYRAASFFGRVYAPELLMGLRSAEEEQDKIIDVTPEKDVSPKANIAQIKGNILSAKSPADLDVIEELIFDIAEEEPRKELMKLLRAREKQFKAPAETEKQVAPKVKEVTQVENVQNTTSNDVVEKSLGKSDDKRKHWVRQINKAKTMNELNEIYELYMVDEMLTDDHKQYLYQSFDQAREKIKAAAEQVEPKPAGVDKIKSQSLVNGLKTMVNDAQNMADLQLVVEQFNGSKAKIDPTHAQEFLSVYAQRKAFLEDQLSMFDEAPAQQESYADRAIARIYAAKNQDDINAEFMDPEFEEQSDQDKQRITIAAQEREQQLLG